MGAREAQYDVVIALVERDGAIQIDATLHRNDKRFDHIVVRGQSEVKNELVGRLVDLLTDRIESSHQAADSE